LSYHVKIDSFEGPFELLLALVTQQKVKIDSISISEVTDQYLEYVQEMEDLDMDVASEFLVVASTLLSIKARSLLPAEKKETEEESDELTFEQAADLLATRIITYYKYKRVASMLGSRMQNESMMHPRTLGPDPEFMGLLPDYLEGVTLEGLGLVCASLMARRETFLLDAEHIAAKPLAVNDYVKSISVRLSEEKSTTFSKLVEDAEDTAHVVVSFLAILEMYKRGMIDLRQPTPEDQIDIDYIEPEHWGEFAAVEEAASEGSEEPDDDDNVDSEDVE
jgi:segregation and condensation protein A